MNETLKTKELLANLATVPVLYAINFTNSFKKDVKRCQKRGLDISILRNAVEILSKTGTLPSEYGVHPLRGKFAGRLECHLQPDWLLVWEQSETQLTLLFTNTGTHADLF